MSKINYTKNLKKPEFNKDLQVQKDKMERYEEIRKKGMEARKAKEKAFAAKEFTARDRTPAKAFIDNREIKKVTFEIDKELAKKLKRYAITKDQPMRDIVEDLLFDLLKDFE